MLTSIRTRLGQWVRVRIAIANLSRLDDVALDDMGIRRECIAARVKGEKL